MSDKFKVWISFGEHGDVTDEQDWEVDGPALSKKFGDDKFYTYYSFREIAGGEAYVIASDHDAKVAELQAKADKLREALEGCECLCHDKWTENGDVFQRCNRCIALEESAGE